MAIDKHTRGYRLVLSGNSSFDSNDLGYQTKEVHNSETKSWSIARNILANLEVHMQRVRVRSKLSSINSSTRPYTLHIQQIMARVKSLAPTAARRETLRQVYQSGGLSNLGYGRPSCLRAFVARRPLCHVMKGAIGPRCNMDQLLRMRSAFSGCHSRT